MPPKAFRVSAETDVRSAPALRFALKLMMAADAMKSAFSWIERLDHDTETPMVRTQRLYALVSGAGWAGETIRCIKDGVAEGWIEASMVEAQVHLAALFDDCLANEAPQRIKKLHMIRGECFGHWDRKSVDRFFDTHDFEPQDLPIIETNGGGKFMETCFPWAYAAIAYHLIGSVNEEVVREQIQEIGRTTAMIAKLVERLLAEILKRGGFRIQAVD